MKQSTLGTLFGRYRIIPISCCPLQEFFDGERKNNTEKEKKLNTTERLATKMRLEYQDSEAARVQFQDELETLKYSVDRTAGDLESTRAKSHQLTREIKDKRKK